MNEEQETASTRHWLLWIFALVLTLVGLAMTTTVLLLELQIPSPLQIGLVCCC